MATGLNLTKKGRGGKRYRIPKVFEGLVEGPKIGVVKELRIQMPVSEILKCRNYAL